MPARSRGCGKRKHKRLKIPERPGQAINQVVLELISWFDLTRILGNKGRFIDGWDRPNDELLIRDDLLVSCSSSTVPRIIERGSCGCRQGRIRSRAEMSFVS
nr:hypothetical protein CFP56_67779 [Quercus suber]